MVTPTEPAAYGSRIAVHDEDLGTGVAARLADHLRTWLGHWDLPVSGSSGVVSDDLNVSVVGSAARTQPAWDGSVHPVVGVASPWGAVLSVTPDQVADVQALGHGDGSVSMAALRQGLAVAIGRPQGRFGLGVFRWCERPVHLPDAGEWVPRTDERVPEWLWPFNGEVLVAWDDEGRYGAGVGRKIHDRSGHELAVVTEERLRGRGIARRLVTQAARTVLADGAVPTYLHAPDNVASARVASASGFPDLGWRVIGVWD